MSEQPPPYQPPPPPPPEPGVGGPVQPPYPPTNQPPGGGYPQPSYPGYSQPYPPQAQYPQAPYPGSPYGAQAPKSHTTRNVLLIVGLVILLFCGGAIGLIALGVHKAKNAIDDYGNYPGAPDHPLTVQAGQPFNIHGTDYSGGWKISPGTSGQDTIDALTATNHRSQHDSESIDIVVKLLQGSTVLAEFGCTSGLSLSENQSKLLDCIRSDGGFGNGNGNDISGYDSIQVNDLIADFNF